MWAQETCQPVWAPVGSSSALTSIEMTRSTALLFPLELGRLGQESGSTSSQWTGHAATSTLASQAPLFYLDGKSQTGPRPCVTPAQWGQRVSGARAEGNDSTEKCLHVPNVQIQSREIINDTLKVRVQGRVREEVSGLCLQVSSPNHLPSHYVPSIFPCSPPEHTANQPPSGPLEDVAPLHLWSSLLSRECFRKEGP